MHLCGPCRLHALKQHDVMSSCRLVIKWTKTRRTSKQLPYVHEMTVVYNGCY